MKNIERFDTGARNTPLAVAGHLFCLPSSWFVYHVGGEEYLFFEGTIDSWNLVIRDGVSKLLLGTRSKGLIRIYNLCFFSRSCRIVFESFTHGI